MPRWFITDVLKRMDDAPRNKRGSARTNFVPFSIQRESEPAVDDVDCFVLIQVIMRRRSATGTRNRRPHCEPSSRALAVQQNCHFFAERTQHPGFTLPNYRR